MRIPVVHEVDIEQEPADTDTFAIVRPETEDRDGEPADEPSRQERPAA